MSCGRPPDPSQEISLADFDTRTDEIASQLCAAAEHVGFFAIVDHGIAPADDNDKKGRQQVYHRAGAHADWGFLTLLFEKEGQSGLEICPGREVVTEHALGDHSWSKVHFVPGGIVCNIGDLLMSWSDDRFKSTFHRVKAPCGDPGDNYGERFSIAFFNQPCKDALIQGPLKKYPLVTGEEFNARAMSKHFAALQAKLRAPEADEGAAVVAGEGAGSSIAVPAQVPAAA
ncbi:leucoanthocyanidin dioxygenase [Apiospora saccharicola]|uniref:Leucoanthocyanidin dioxygenase n=1 Tax=Apiospora saccharicola TaxID=335842 RepID=A0ABR1W4J0_9PEZI